MAIKRTPARSPVLEAVRRRQGDVLDANCPSRQVLRHVTSQWGVLLLMVLAERTHRFSELRRKVGGVSEKMLSQTLKWLESDGFIDRVSRPVVPPHVEYTLTPLGREVAAHVGALADWIETSLPAIERVRAARAPVTVEAGG